jgi:MoaA/NifB/PqqE/SkfB family radical SAM enzyme
MGEHLIFCSDLARRDPSDQRVIRLEGWCIASSPLIALYLETSNALYEQMPFGFARPDVRDAYPHYPHAEHSGFRLSTDYRSIRGTPSTVWVKVESGLHCVSVNLETRDVQTIELNAKTRVDNDSDIAAAIEETAGIEKRVRKSLGKKRGLTLRLDIINKCNLRCVMCHFSDDAIFKRPTKQLTVTQFKNLFDDIGPSVREVMLSCGDEPLVSKHLPGILEYLAQEHPEVSIMFCTNATLLGPPIRKLIMQTYVARLVFSLDAVTKPLLESIRVGCRYEQVVGNIMALRDLRSGCGARHPAFVFNFVMMNQNIHEAPAFVRMAHALGAESIDFRHVVPIEAYFPPDNLLSDRPGKYNFYRARILTEAERLGIHVYLPPPFSGAQPWNPPAEGADVDLSDFERVRPDPLGDSFPFVPRDPDDEFSSWEGSVAEEFSTTFCNRPFSEIMVRDQEEVLPCPWHAKPLGFLSEGKTLAEIFNGEAFQRLRRNMLRPEGDPGCANCPIKSQHLPTDA